MLKFLMNRNDIIERTREFRREFDVIKQRITRVCSLVKTLLDVILSLFRTSALLSSFRSQDFSIAAEFRCTSNNDLWQQLRQNSYIRIKINRDSSVRPNLFSLPHHTGILI